MDKESKGKFSGKNLYKLTKILVIFISLLSLLLLLQSVQWINHAYDGCSQYSSGSSLWESCNYSAAKVQQNSIDLIGTSIKGIVLLPLFFGGTWLYKYLFPKE